MLTRDIQHYAESRTQARAYFCYLLSKNLPNNLPSISEKSVIDRLRKIMGDLKDCEGVYLLNEKGDQVTSTYLPDGSKTDTCINQSRANRAYYYRAMKEKRCTITDPYPSLITKDLTITASKPIFNTAGEIKYVACLDMPLSAVLKIAHPMPMKSVMGRVFRIGYAMFTLVLAMVSLLLFLKGVGYFFTQGINFHTVDVKDVFNATILLTLSLAMFDLVKTLFEEEVLGRYSENHSTADPHKTMVRFLGSIIIALSIEALMLVFKFAMTEPDKLITAMYLIGGVSLLLVSLAVYIKFTGKRIEE
ncbi:MAG: PDC sensor domain-containing protein [Helicobacteraceae bacterium]|jgi:hypothetical protein|nr:PDC sensor domain-containing protein [Helicobacteraceae bacterium]